MDWMLASKYAKYTGNTVICVFLLNTVNKKQKKTH